MEVGIIKAEHFELIHTVSILKSSFSFKTLDIKTVSKFMAMKIFLFDTNLGAKL